MDRKSSDVSRVEKLLDMQSVSTMNKMAERKGAEEVELKYIRHLFSSCESIANEKVLPDHLNYKKISADDNVVLPLDIVLKTFSSMIAHEGLIALKMYKTPNSYIIEVK